jgi:hypothetical protein
MSDKRPGAINIMAILAILLIWLFFWVYAKTEFAWGVLLTVLLLLTVAYANIRKPLTDHIEARKKAKNKPVDVREEKTLMLINYSAIIIIFAIDAFVWFFLPRGDLVLAIYLMIAILLAVCFINVRKVIADIA